MKFLHFADFHLGMENYGGMSPSGLHQRVEEFLGVLDGICEVVERESVDVVFFCGDAFKNREPSQTLVVEFAKRVTRMRRAGAEVFLLVGNHDMPMNASKANTLDIYEALGLEGVHVGRSFRAEVVKLASGQRLRVVYAPWVMRQMLFGADGFEKLSTEELGLELGKYVKGKLKEVAGSKAGSYGMIEGAAFDATVVMCHGTVSGGINWGLVGFFNYNLIEVILSTWPSVVTTVYALIGVSALFIGFTCVKGCK